MRLPEFNINSTKHLSAILFGGEIECEAFEAVTLKSGQVKLKKVKKMCYVKGIGLNPQKELETKKKGVYKTNADVLQILANS